MTSNGTRTRLLVVNDNPFLREAMSEALQAREYVVAAHGHNLTLESVVRIFRPDLAIFELEGSGNNPGGLALGRRLRSMSTIPLIFLSTSASLEDRLTGFALGADDVLMKPFAMPELYARLTAVLRRCGRDESAVLTAGDIVIDDLAHIVTRADEPVDLTSIEFRLLSAFMRHRGQVLTKVQLLSEVWGFEHYDVNLVEVHVSALRRKIEAYGPRVIHTVRGVGYVLRPNLRHEGSIEEAGTDAMRSASQLAG